MQGLSLLYSTVMIAADSMCLRLDMKVVGTTWASGQQIELPECSSIAAMIEVVP
jgi:hypothetical protein